MADPKQELYNRYMNIATQMIYENMKEFDLDQLSSIMINNVDEMIKQYPEHDREKYKKHYRIRERDDNIQTAITSLLYPNILNIFFSKLELFIKEDHSEFKCSVTRQACEEATCSEQEIEESEKDLDQTKIQPGIIYKAEPHEQGVSRCKKCFKFNPNLDGITFTNKMLDQNPNIYGCINGFVQIKIKLPILGEYVYVSKLMYVNRFGRVYHKYPSFWQFYLYHTEPIYFYLILEEIKKIWNKLSTKEDCYMIHWLFCNLTPFWRGSAGCAKVLLNVCLLRLGQSIVKETKKFHAQSDWVALLTPDFNKYYEEINKLFEKDPEFKQQNVLNESKNNGQYGGRKNKMNKSKKPKKLKKLKKTQKSNKQSK
jgi:hypothetical protein